jgi:hypothetical protein
MSYFVTIEGFEKISNLTKAQAVSYAEKEYKNNPENGMLNIGIGKVKYRNGKLVYTCLPMHFYSA